MSEVPTRAEVMRRWRWIGVRPSKLALPACLYWIPLTLLILGVTVAPSALSWMKWYGVVLLSAGVMAAFMVESAIRKTMRLADPDQRPDMRPLVLLAMRVAAILLVVAVTLATLDPWSAAVALASLNAGQLIVRSLSWMVRRRRGRLDILGQLLRGALWGGVATSVALSSAMGVVAFALLDVLTWLTAGSYWRDRLDGLPTEERYRLGLLGDCAIGGG